MTGSVVLGKANYLLYMLRISVHRPQWEFLDIRDADGLCFQGGCEACLDDGVFNKPKDTMIE